MISAENCDRHKFNEHQTVEVIKDRILSGLDVA